MPNRREGGESSHLAAPVSILAADAGDDALIGLLAGVVATCSGCGRAEGEIECEGCGDRLCPDCWGAGEEMFCGACLDEEPEPGPSRA